MAKLNDEESAILNRLRESERNRPQSCDTEPITNPKKYTFPIGLDDEGEPFEDSSEPDETRASSDPE